jgi:nucleotide-binding universal stress UspA family protein
LFEKILVPIDGSEHSKRALEAALQIGKKFGSRIMVFTVYHVSVSPVTNPELPMGPGVVIDASSSNAAATAACHSAERILMQAKMMAQSQNVGVEIESAEGNAVEEIVEKSREGKFDLVIMGARGLGTIKKIFIGSVSEGVIKNAPCPVLIVK